MAKYWGLLIVLSGTAWMVACAIGWQPSEVLQAVAIGLALVVGGAAYALSSFAVEP